MSPHSVSRTATILCSFALAALPFAFPATVAAESQEYVALIRVDDGNADTDDRAWAVNSVNSPSCKSYAVITSGDYQFLSYYGSDTRLNVARRNLRQSPRHWDILRTKFTSYNARDRHNTSCIAIDGDGYLHIAWGVHNNPLLYTRSPTPLANGEPLHLIGENAGNDAALRDAIPLQQQTRSITYPEFWRIPNSGDLLFTFRVGASGNGEYQLVRWNDSLNTWNEVHAAIGTRASGGAQPLIDNVLEGGPQPNANAYLNDLAFDRRGRLHLTWTWRTGGDSRSGFRDYQTNHDIMYACSDDQGVSWKDFRGQPYRREGVHDIDEINAAPVLQIPEGSSLINQSNATVGPDGKYYLATYWAPRANEEHHLRQCMLVVFDGKSWKTHQIGARSAENENQRVAEAQLSKFRMSRPVVLVDDDNRVIILFVDHQRGSGISAAYSERMSRDDWKFLNLDRQPMGRWEPRYDPERWQRDGVISLYYEPEGTNAELMDCGVFEWNARQFFQQQLPR